MDTLLLGLALLDGVLLHSGQKFLSGAGMRNVFDAHIDTLLHVSVADALVDDDTDGGFGHVVDNTGFAVVDLEWHTIENPSRLASTSSDIRVRVFPKKYSGNLVWSFAARGFENGVLTPAGQRH